MPASPTSVAAAPTSRCARRSIPRQGMREADMNAITNMNRRSFLVGSAAVTGGFSLGFHVPGSAAEAAEATPEVNAWVVIKPDDTVVIRIARSEMGQGTLTGLAQLV